MYYYNSLADLTNYTYNGTSAELKNRQKTYFLDSGIDYPLNIKTFLVIIGSGVNYPTTFNVGLPNKHF